VAVATAGTTTGNWSREARAQRGELDNHNVLELTRVASDGTVRGASSQLVSRLINLLDVSKRGESKGPALLITYQLSTQDGTSYKTRATLLRSSPTDSWITSV